MARGKVGVYDDRRLVEMLAGGAHTYAEIGQALGLTEGHVGRIARGERRPRVMAEVRARVEAALAESRRVAVRRCRALMERHVEIGLAGRGETARKCREFVLSRLDLARPARALVAAARGSHAHGPQPAGFVAAPGADADAETATAETVGWVERSEDPPAASETEAWMAELVKSQGARPRPTARRNGRGRHPNYVPLGVR